MKTLTVLTTVTILAIGTGAHAVVPDLYVDDQIVNADSFRLADEDEDIIFDFSGDSQSWRLITEQTNHRLLNSFGIYTDLAANGGSGLNTTTIIQRYNSEGYFTRTFFNDYTDVGFWLLNDLNSDGIYNGYDSYLYSERSLTRSSGNDDNQWFMVYDTHSFGPSTFRYGDVTFWGGYQYLLFIDDSRSSGPNYDYDDMIIGLNIVPEPGTLLLFGTGLIGTGLIIRRHRKN